METTMVWLGSIILEVEDVGGGDGGSFAEHCLDLACRSFVYGKIHSSFPYITLYNPM